MKIIRTLCSVVLSCLILGQSVSAQDNAMHEAGSESVTLKVGDIFEILPVHDFPTGSSYTWILTQDRTFLEATRAPMFRKRFIQPGTYSLFADIVSPDGSRRITRTFTIEYQARQPGEPIAQPSTSDTGKLVSTEPPMDAMDRVAMPASTQLIRLNPINPNITPLALDLDLNRDADGDGSSDNDIEGNETFFASDATPLYLWIADEPLTRHPISVTASLPDGARVQKIEILEESLARSEGVVQGPVMISAEKTSDRTYQFTAVFDGATPAGGQLLYQWQFGDGKQSLVNSPSHEYADDGDYTVQLLIRNLRDGKEMANTSTTVSVSGTDAMPSSEPTQNSSSATNEPPQNTNTSFSLGSVLLLVGIFVGSLIIGAIVMMLLSLLRRNKGSMAQKIEQLEKAVVKPTESTPALTITPPTQAEKPITPATVAPVVQPKLQTPPPEIAKREEQRATSNPVTQPAQTVNAKAAPAWLQQPAPKPTQVTKPAEASAPAPVQAPRQSQPAPVAPATPKPVTPPQQQAPKQPTPAPQPPSRPNAPAWLQQPATPSAAASVPQTQNKPAQPAMPPQTPKPQPIPSPTPTPVPTPIQPPTPAPKPAEASMPAAVAPVPPPAPLEQKTPDLPIPQEIQSSGDKPIAIITAESLNQENQQNG